MPSGLGSLLDGASGLSREPGRWRGHSMKRTELRQLTRRELYEMAKAYDVPGRSRMGKEELVDHLCRVSARESASEPRSSKRRMAKRRHRKTGRGTARPVLRHEPPAQAPTSGMPAERQTQPQPYVDRGPELPPNYGKDKLQVMVRDPNWIYAYWDLSGGVRSRLDREVRGGVWVLRVHNVGSGSYEDVPVLVEGGNWYLPVASDTEYRLEIGVIDPSGTFHVAASSAVIRTPRMGMSDVADEEWMILEEEFRRLMEYSGQVSRQMSGSRILSEFLSGRHRLAGMHSAGVSSLGGSRRK
jgi:hypothetical protein